MPKKSNTARDDALVAVKALVDDPLVTIDEVCAAARRSKSSIYADIRDRRLLIERIGGSTRVRTSILKRYLVGAAMPADAASAPLREPACIVARRARKAAEGRAP